MGTVTLWLTSQSCNARPLHSCCLPLMLSCQYTLETIHVNSAWSMAFTNVLLLNT